MICNGFKKHKEFNKNIYKRINKNKNNSNNISKFLNRKYNHIIYLVIVIV